MQKMYLIGVHHNVKGNSDHTYVLAKDEAEALKIGIPILKSNRPRSDFFNKHDRIYAREVK